MTSKRTIQLAKRVEMWQKHLEPLGLAHWRIEQVSTTESPDGQDHSDACVHSSARYDSCWFEFRNEFVDNAYDTGDFSYLDQTILHEWLHVAFRDLHDGINSVDDHLSNAVQATWDARIEFEVEGLIERLARQMYASFQSDVVV